MNEGFYEIYLDGDLYTQGYNLSRSAPIEGKGIFIIGQEQDRMGGGNDNNFFLKIYKNY